MSEESRNVTLADIGNGEFIELANDDIVKLLADIRDPNKQAGSTRQLTMTLTFKTNDKRKTVEVEYKTSTKFGTRESGKSLVFVTGEGKEVESAMAPLNQPSFTFDDRSN